MRSTIFRFSLIAFVMAVCLAIGASSVSAQTSCDGDFCEEEEDRSEVLTLIPVSKPSTDTIVTAVKDTTRGCREVLIFPPQIQSGNEVYQIDCLRLHYKKIAASIPETGDYKGVKKALEDASRQLDAIVRQNQDVTQRAVEIHERGKPDAPLVDGFVRPIKKERLAAAQAAAAKVIKETALVILRSGEIPTRRNVHYTAIASAVTSNLVVLRSA